MRAARCRSLNQQKMQIAVVSLAAWLRRGTRRDWTVVSADPGLQGVARERLEFQRPWQHPGLWQARPRGRCQKNGGGNSRWDPAGGARRPANAV